MTPPAAWDLPYPDPPEVGYELYRHRNAAALRARRWHGLYWARRTARGDYELRSVPATIGEPSAAGGTMPGEAFDRLYEKVEPGDPGRTPPP